MKSYISIITLIIITLQFSTAQWSAPYSNNGSGSFNGWNINVDDKYIVNNFVMGSSSETELLCVHGPYLALMDYTITQSGWAWTSVYFNGGIGSFGSWVISSTDKYTAMGHESYNGRLLSVNPSNNWAAVQRYNVNTGNFVSDWGNNGNGAINGWIIRSNDQYVSGNFVSSSSPEHEILLISSQTGHVATQRFTGSSWTALNWTTNGKIGNIWNVSSNDKYRAGDFDNDGTDELLCVNQNGWAMLLKYNGSDWQSIWSNNMNYYIGDCPIGSADVYLRGKVTEGNKVQLMVINTIEDISYLLQYAGGSWSTIVSNSDWIGGWNIATHDQYAMLGMLNHHKLFTSNYNGWSNLMQFDVAPAAPQNLSVSAYYNGIESYPRLTWTAINEWDVQNNSQGLQIWRRIHNGIKWLAYSSIETIGGTNLQYIDYGTVGAGTGPMTAEYKIRAVDLGGNIGGFSTVQSIRYGTAMQKGSVNDVALPSKFVLESNYPNPFNPTTTISYGLPVQSNVSISVFNALGQLVSKEYFSEQSAGFHHYTFSAGNLSSGTYYYQFFAAPVGNENDAVHSPMKETRKMFLLK